VYESVARRAVQRLWDFRSNVTGLFGKILYSCRLYLTYNLM